MRITHRQDSLKYIFSRLLHPFQQSLKRNIVYQEHRLHGPLQPLVHSFRSGAQLNSAPPSFQTTTLFSFTSPIVAGAIIHNYLTKRFLVACPIPFWEYDCSSLKPLWVYPTSFWRTAPTLRNPLIHTRKHIRFHAPHSLVTAFLFSSSPTTWSSSPSQQLALDTSITFKDTFGNNTKSLNFSSSYLGTSNQSSSSSSSSF